MEVAIEAAATTTYMDVITKFKDLKKRYYTDRGCMISTVNDDFSKKFMEKHPDLEWREKYNKYADAYILTAKLNINIFGKPFVIYLHRPKKQIHRYEFEYFFGFGGHNDGFSYNRIIVTFQETLNENVDIEYLLMAGTLMDAEGNERCVIDEKYIKNALKLLVIGGYVKRWNAFNEFKDWFKERGFKFEINTDSGRTLTSFIFEDYKMFDE